MALPLRRQVHCCFTCHLHFGCSVCPLINHNILHFGCPFTVNQIHYCRNCLPFILDSLPLAAAELP